LQRFDCSAVLVACGTVSSNAIDLLRARFDFPFFGRDRRGGARGAAGDENGPHRGHRHGGDGKQRRFERKSARLGAEAVFSKACQSLVAVTEAGHLAPDDPAVVAAVSRSWRRCATGRRIRSSGLHAFPAPRAGDRGGAGGGRPAALMRRGGGARLRAYLEENGATAARSAGTQRYFTSGDPRTFPRARRVSSAARSRRSARKTEDRQK
jgi:hypothetical protein